MEREVSERFERSFWMLLTDSILLLDRSEQEQEPDIANAIARSSILSSLIIPEVAANCCIDSLALDRGLFNEIDRLSVLGKFEFYLRSRFRNRSIDRGSKPVQGLQELKKLRDRFVHPKKYKVLWDHLPDDTAQAQRVESPVLGIAVNPMDWWSADGVIAMRATHEFLRYFFVECCRFSRPQVSALLCSEEEKPGPNSYFVPYLYKNTRRTLANWQVDVGYFKVGWL